MEFVKEKNLLFNGYQLEQYGGSTFYGDNMFFRYYESKKFFVRNIYIPYGPVAKNIEGVNEFIQYIDKIKFSKIKIDLPVILEDKTKYLIKSRFENAGYKKGEYILDDETLVISPNNFSLNSRNMRYVRQGERSFDVKVKSDFTMDELKEMYDVYSYSMEQKNIKPRPFSAFEEICKNTVSSVAYDLETGTIGGVLIGYTNYLPDKDFSDSNNFVKTLQLMFTGLSEKGRNVKLGFALHWELFSKCFRELTFDYIDFQGASRNRGASFVEFKKMFGGEFIELPGSYEKINLL